MVGPPPGGKGGYFRLDGVPIVGGTVYVYAFSRFTGAPKENDTPPVTSDYGPATTDSAGHWSVMSPADGYYHASCDYTDPNGQPRRSWQSVLWDTPSSSGGGLSCLADGDPSNISLPTCYDSTTGLYGYNNSQYRAVGVAGAWFIQIPEADQPGTGYTFDGNQQDVFVVMWHVGRTPPNPLFEIGCYDGEDALTIQFSGTSADERLEIQCDTVLINGQFWIPAGTSAPPAPVNSVLAIAGSPYAMPYYRKDTKTLYMYNPDTGAQDHVTLT